MAITTNNLISRQTVGSGGAASVTFSSIPQTFTDLRLVMSARSSDSANRFQSINLSINGVTTNRTVKYLYGNGTSANSVSDTGAYAGQTNAGVTTASCFSNNEWYFPNYAGSNYKSFSSDQVGESNETRGDDYLLALLWSSADAITSFTFSSASGNWVEFSTFSLYGISSSTSTQNTSVPSATGGDVITTDGTYWYHQFLYSGTFTPLKALTADYLVVAGGGAGGSGGYDGSPTAGGGAGGFRTASGQSLLEQAYTVTIGAGGAANNTGGGNNGGNGGTSTFDTTSSSGGGGGHGSAAASNGNNGGSGGGAWNGNAGSGNAGSYSPVEGYAGGSWGTSGNYGAGGGGGGSAVGANGTSSIGGNGGAGGTSSISGSSVTYAGGGGGGSYGSNSSGGSGGGGAGKGSGGGAGTAGSMNLGGGGGGTPGAASGGNGGSGIVIVRYAV